MRRGTLALLLFIILLGACAIYIDLPNTPGLHIPFLGINNSLQRKLGFDLQGGVSALLVTDGNFDAKTLNDAMPAVRDNIEQRVNGGLGVSEPSIRIITTNSQPAISVELPGFTGNQTEAVNSLLKTGNLEFWSTGSSPAAIGSAFDPSQYAQYNPGGKAQFTGADLDSSQVFVSQDQAGRPQISFEMQGDAISRFGTFTGKNVGQYLTVTLDKQVIESAVIKNAIAAAIGLGIVMLFMLLYYRLPGLLADIALILYALLTFAVFKLLGVVLSLAGITGFVLSIGMAVDANVLIFERVKEELRAGRLLSAAIDVGWKRAWPSIRDSNISTLITCAVLFAFGSNFGATIIVGFATTLFLGVLISMFTAVVVTRTFLNLLVPTGVVSHPALFGLPPGSLATASASLARRNSTVSCLSRERKKDVFDLVGKRYLFILISLIV